MYGYSALSSIEAGTRALSRRGGRYSDHAWPCHIGSFRHLLCCESLSEERSAGNPHATFCGSRRWVTASGDPVSGSRFRAAESLFIAKSCRTLGRFDHDDFHQTLDFIHGLLTTNLYVAQ